MILYTNGDSHTECRHLQNKQDAWPQVLADKLGMSLNSDAFGGASNDRIVRTTSEYLFMCDQDPDLVVIGWTERNRFELPAFNGQHIRLFSNDAISDDVAVEVNPDVDAVRKVYYKQCHNEFLAAKKFLVQVLTLQELFKSRDIPYVFFNAFNLNNLDALALDDKDLIHWVLTDYYEVFKYEKVKLAHNIPKAYAELQRLFLQINSKRWLGFPDETFLTLCEQHPLDEGYHFLEAGNACLATQLAELYDTLY